MLLTQLIGIFTRRTRNYRAFLILGERGVEDVAPYKYTEC